MKKSELKSENELISEEMVRLKLENTRLASELAKYKDTAAQYALVAQKMMAQLKTLAGQLEQTRQTNKGLSARIVQLSLENSQLKTSDAADAQKSAQVILLAAKRKAEKIVQAGAQQAEINRQKVRDPDIKRAKSDLEKAREQTQAALGALSSSIELLPGEE